MDLSQKETQEDRMEQHRDSPRGIQKAILRFIIEVQQRESENANLSLISIAKIDPNPEIYQIAL
jgi:hypothetical protein